MRRHPWIREPTDRKQRPGLFFLSLDFDLFNGEGLPARRFAMPSLAAKHWGA
jgi:hypothetical protein